MRKKYRNNFSKGSQISLFKSYLNGGEYIWGQSQLERNAQRFYEYDPEVISFKSQPKQYAYIDASGKERSYTPDLSLETLKGERIKETKPVVFTKSDKAIEQFNHLRMCFHEAQILNLSYITDETVYAGETTENLKRIHHYRRLDISKISVPSLTDAIGKTPTFGSLKTYIESIDFQAKHALALLGHQVFRFDYQKPLTTETQLTFVEEA
ncbi:hypothetical protein [Thalassotalea piscium]|uniref:TnsA endonuclease N-terminal domain-containing protein n=1 Tax=Thalassotalea piscium TaxID=1230533 RepID=A0A7X0TUH8_9GAMM|nr:hypothetical protein [Thalassotalea piscium]MBB6544110.1 hypothetical protein [Thalassotalea piscium]